MITGMATTNPLVLGEKRGWISPVSVKPAILAMIEGILN